MRPSAGCAHSRTLTALSHSSAAPAYGPHALQLLLLTHSLCTEQRNRFSPSERTTRILPLPPPRDEGKLRSPTPSRGVGPLPSHASLLLFGILKLPFGLIFAVVKKLVSKVSKSERDKRNTSLFPGCLLGSFDIVLWMGCLISVFPLCGHLNSFLLFLTWFSFRNDAKREREKPFKM